MEKKNRKTNTRSFSKRGIALLAVCITLAASVVSVSAAVNGTLVFYHGANSFWKHTYGKTTSTTYENSMQFIGLINYQSGPKAGQTYYYESAKKYNTKSHAQYLYPGFVKGASYFLYFVDDICQHQSSSWWPFDFR